MQKIYCVEDDSSIRELLIYALRSAGFEAEGFENASDFTAAVAVFRPALVLLDIMLPDRDGLKVLRELRSRNETKTLPVILLTAKGSRIDKVTGLDGGADDYITKPFEMIELLARVETVLRRYHKTEDEIQVLDAIINIPSRTVMQNGQQVELTMKEFDLLLFLVRNKNIALYRETIYENVWENDYMGDSRTVDLHIQRLRKKMNWGKFIKAVYKVGYRLEV